jgi:cytochrome c oxidase assembly protein subunit 15
LARESLVSTLALCACFFALGVIGLGAFTRLMDAGLGCPDWPGCYGHMMVPVTAKAREVAATLYPNTHLVTFKAWAEMIHRYFAGCLGFLIIAVIIAMLKNDFHVRSNVVLAICLVGLLAYQILLGQLTVTLKLLPIIVTQHLLGGFLIVSTLWLIYLNNHFELEWGLKVKHAFSPEVMQWRKKLIPWAYVGLFILLTQIILGAWTSTNYASLSCPDFPFCMNDQATALHFKEAFNIFAPVGVNYEGGVMSESIRQTIQMSHRIGALIVSLYIFIFTIFSLIKFQRVFELLKSLYVILGLLCLQLSIGISNVIFKLPVITAVSHSLVAVLLLLSMITFTFKLINFKTSS